MQAVGLCKETDGNGYWMEAPCNANGAMVTLHFMSEYTIFIGFATFLWLSCQLWEECLRPGTFCVERCGQLFCLVEGRRWAGHSCRSVNKQK